ncbi:MAG: hypothetical protein ACT4PP_04925 [Sporichthyaceae bacterium]
MHTHVVHAPAVRAIIRSPGREVADLQKTLLNMVTHKNITTPGKQNAAYLTRAKLDESTTHRSQAS